jgi:alpha-galactosidase
VLDPRFPEVREFLASLYVKAQKECGLDGFKLDFIDSFTVRGTDPAVAEGYAGRDIRTVPDAVNVLMGEIVRRLRANDPDVLIEFRQNYIGPAVTQYGNMMRAADCPGDRQANRVRIADLRLTSGRAAVHADMLEWNVATPVEEAAGSVLSAIFGTVQYSMMLSDLPPDHLRMIAHWVKFGAEHCDALQRGSFKAHEPEAGYPLLCGESALERIFGVYGNDRVVRVADLEKTTFVLNGTGIGSLCLELPRDASFEVRDTFGVHVRRGRLAAGLNRVSVPLGGFVIFVP